MIETPNESATEGLELESPPGPEIVLGGKRYRYFGGTSYHCLQGRPELVDAIVRETKTYGMGTATGGAHPIGRGPVQKRLEQRSAEFFGSEDSVCIASGYLANTVGINGLAEQFDHIFADETCHYSVIDAARIAAKPITRFRHRDAADLAEKLRSELGEGEVPLVASDGVFPTFGELAPVDRYLEAVDAHDGLIWLDDAHGVGVLGPRGCWTLDHYGISSARCHFCGSLAKAFGGHGGVVPGSRELCEHIRATSLILKGASAISVPNAAASTAGIELVSQHPEWRDRLAANARRFKGGLRSLGFDLADSPHPVAAFSLGSATRNGEVHAELMARGIVIQVSRYVGAGDEGVLRVVLFSGHTDEQIDELLAALRELV